MLVETKSIAEFDQIEKDVQALYGKLDPDSSNMALKVFKHFIQNYKTNVLPGNYALFSELAKLYVVDNDILNNVKIKESNVDKNPAGEQNDLQKMLRQYSGMCEHNMNCNPKKALLEDLTEKGNLGQISKEMDLSIDEYIKLCHELLDYVE